MLPLLGGDDDVEPHFAGAHEIDVHPRVAEWREQTVGDAGVAAPSAHAQAMPGKIKRPFIYKINLLKTTT